MFSEIDKKILRILLEEKGPVSGKTLALRCNVSINTVRKEVSLINEEVESKGFRISSKTATGHYLEIFDSQKAEPYLERLRYVYKRSTYLPRQYSEEVAYLVRKCLCASGYVTIEELCEELYCSRSTMLRYLERVKTILEKYKLTLVNRRGHGLHVEGSEWNIRQCLLYQHKVYSLKADVNEHKEYAFKTIFFMMDGADYYEQVRRELLRCLQEQHDFLLPLMNMPKIVNYILLVASRSKQASGYAFTQEQIDRASNTAEYRFVEKLRSRLPARFQNAFDKNDHLALTMLILSFETQNRNLKSMEEYTQYYEEVQEFIGILTEQCLLPKQLFDDVFVEDFICFLYTLNNCRIFHVHSDTELLEFVRHRGIRTSDICINFSRFYEHKHGIRLEKKDALGAFYMINRVVRGDHYCYYAQKILVISRYGLQYSRAMATKIRLGYGKEVAGVEAGEFCNLDDDAFLEYDLLLTDVKPDRIYELTSHVIPMLQVHFYLGRDKCPELDRYLCQLRIETERRYFGKDNFHHRDVTTKKEVFEYLAALFVSADVQRENLIRHMEENDEYMDMERENGVVFAAVMAPEVKEAKVEVLLSKTGFVWDERHAHIFVCYSRIPSPRENQIISSILKRFITISAENAEKLILDRRIDPIQVLYSEKDE